MLGSPGGSVQWFMQISQEELHTQAVLEPIFEQFSAISRWTSDC